jgi:hypothetical protein
MLNKKGLSHIKTAVIVLILAMTLSAIMTYASIMTIIQTASDNTKLALDSYVTHNSIEIYDSLKNGSDFTVSLEKNIFKDEILSVFSLDISGNMVYSTSKQGEILYKMTIPNVDFEYENTLKLGAAYDVIIPVTFAGNHLFDLQIPQKVTSYYNLK